ncbi:hypothetical protein Tco_0385681 [Tanacetum coccineum]
MERGTLRYGIAKRERGYGPVNVDLWRRVFIALVLKCRDVTGPVNVDFGEVFIALFLKCRVVLKMIPAQSMLMTV